MRERLCRLRNYLPSFLWLRVWRAYWWIHWTVEFNRERIRQRRFVTPRLHGSERALLVESVGEVFPIASILEIGCGFGQSLHYMAKMFPDAKEIIGIDIDSERISVGQQLLKDAGMDHVRLFVQDAKDLSLFPSGSFDVVYASASLLFVPPETINAVLSEMIRVAKVRVVLLEQHKAGLVEDGRFSDETSGKLYWIRDYRLALGRASGQLTVQTKRVANPLWITEKWKEYATLIEVIK